MGLTYALVRRYSAHRSNPANASISRHRPLQAARDKPTVAEPGVPVKRPPGFVVCG